MKYRTLLKSEFDKKVRRYLMSCKCNGKCHEKGKKAKVFCSFPDSNEWRNNQWCGASVVGNTDDHQMKTEFSNEWASTNKMGAVNQETKKSH